MSHKQPCPTPGYGDTFILILVLFILLVIIGATYMY
ncbi:YjcZ family sporulation protein [Bacillus shivajii]|nr:YjcZ family sporulation protein [Bacillus shivajii]UCZ54187.1 YjcZ family sporulation protein [Bacillus shivajii]